MPIDTTAPVLPARAVVLTDPDTGEELSTVTATVVSVEHREENGIYGPMVGLDARLHVLFSDDTQPHSYFLSRLLEEEYWVQDAHFGPTSFPHFSHGFGARYLKLRGIHPALEALLDEAARTRGLATAIGPDIPLTLAASSDEPSDHA
ncbi:hypothetical protein [Amycolatopsis sp. NPDC004378]